MCLDVYVCLIFMLVCVWGYICCMLCADGHSMKRKDWGVVHYAGGSFYRGEGKEPGQSLLQTLVLEGISSMADQTKRQWGQGWEGFYVKKIEFIKQAHDQTNGSEEVLNCLYSVQVLYPTTFFDRSSHRGRSSCWVKSAAQVCFFFGASAVCGLLSLPIIIIPRTEEEAKEKLSLCLRQVTFLRFPPFLTFATSPLSSPLFPFFYFLRFSVSGFWGFILFLGSFSHKTVSYTVCSLPSTFPVSPSLSEQTIYPPHRISLSLA